MKRGQYDRDLTILMWLWFFVGACMAIATFALVMALLTGEV